MPDPDAASRRFRLPDGLRLYAIGDIHGRLDLLERLLGMVERDAAGHGEARLIFLGDYVDRGPDSRGVIERVRRLQAERGAVCLTGNHEAMMLAALEGRGAADPWLANGGREALASYGVETDMLQGAQAVLPEAARAIPAEHLAFLSGLKFSAGFGDYFFCHAGVRPGVPLERQSRDDLIWIRHVFLESAADFGKRIVHGHTPVAEVDIRHNRINVDTGAWKTDRLSCVALEGGEVRVLQS